MGGVLHLRMSQVALKLSYLLSLHPHSEGGEEKELGELLTSAAKVLEKARKKCKKREEGVLVRTL